MILPLCGVLDTSPKTRNTLSCISAPYLGAVSQTGDSFDNALEAVSSTPAGRQLRDLANGEHRHEKTQDWQGSVFAERAEGRLRDLGRTTESTLSRFAATCLSARG